MSPRAVLGGGGGSRQAARSRLSHSIHNKEVLDSIQLWTSSCCQCMHQMEVGLSSGPSPATADFKFKLSGYPRCWGGVARVGNGTCAASSSEFPAATPCAGISALGLACDRGGSGPKSRAHVLAMGEGFSGPAGAHVAQPRAGARGRMTHGSSRHISSTMMANSQEVDGASKSCERTQKPNRASERGERADSPVLVQQPTG